MTGDTRSNESAASEQTCLVDAEEQTAASAQGQVSNEGKVIQSPCVATAAEAEARERGKAFMSQS